MNNTAKLKEGSQVVSATTQLKLLAPDGKKRLSDMRSGMDFPGNATLRSGENEYANQEIGAPGVKTEKAYIRHIDAIK